MPRDMTALSASPHAHETKYVLDDHGVPAVRGWLGRVCTPEGRYPENVVSSIYFDTLQWTSLDEKRNSDFLKSKIRIRWYGSFDGTERSRSAFLEAKIKVGTIRRKLRLAIPFSGKQLDRIPLESPALWAIPGRLREEGVDLPGFLVPTLQISYERRRYVDRQSGTAICLDSGIRVPRVNRRMLAVIHPGRLPRAVVEVKGPTRQLPPALRHLPHLGCRRDSFSKYEACCEVASPSSGRLVERYVVR